MALVKLNHYYTVNGHNLRFFYHIFFTTKMPKRIYAKHMGRFLHHDLVVLILSEATN